MDSTNKVNPGMHPNFSIDSYSQDEQKILTHLKAEWYVTSSGASFGPHIRLGASEYRFFLLKPTSLFSEMFNIEREIVSVFSPYDTFEPRTLDAFDAARSRLQDLRVENVCYVLISKDLRIESTIENLLKTDPEQPIVIPFSYQELLSSYDPYFIRNRFRKHFYTRDLFSFLSPLKKDLYFFGRSSLVHEIVNRHRSGEHTGLFGLRKSGKTSIIYAVERLMQLNDECNLSVDCESPSIHKLRWHELLFKIASLYQKTKSSNVRIADVSQYTEKTAADQFFEDMIKVYSSKKRTSTLLILDEIERISPKTGSSEHWRADDDFVYFWQALRGFYQKYPEVLTYLIVGTNPSSVEHAMIGIHENPLFSSIPCQFVPSFSLEQVRDMVRKLGRYMGIKFDELIYSKLFDDFGGHPFLIRQFCSHVNRTCQGDRPVVVDKALYDRAKQSFMDVSTEYLDMIIRVLQDWYPDEYDMLTFLANNDLESFKSFAADHAQYTRHLLGYGLINSGPNGYSFNIECIKEFLAKKHKYERINLTEDEKLQEITLRRNKIEKSLRGLIKNSLRLTYGKKAGEKVLSSIEETRRKKLGTNNIEALLDRDKSPLFFLDLINIVNREWVSFQNVFEMEKEKVLMVLNDINSSGRPDAHAKGIADDDFTQLRLHFKKLEAILEEWNI